MSKKLFGFSVAELIIILISIAVITSSLVPIITKRLTDKKTIMNAPQITRKCQEHCALCEKTIGNKTPKCLVCNIECENNTAPDRDSCTCASCTEPFGPACEECNSLTCTKCRAGYFIESTTGKCELCEKADNYHPEENKNMICEGRSHFAISCPGGYISDKNHSICIECGSGRIANNKTGTCEVCQEGTYAGERHIQCFDCAPGHYCTQGIKKPCPAGTKQIKNEKFINVCLVCPNGTYQSKNGQTDCINCESGKFANGPLPEHHYQCISCENGHYAGEGAIVCTPHTVQNCFEYEDKKDACYSCKAGFALVNGNCTQCPEGKYSGDGTMGNCISRVIPQIPFCGEVNSQNGTCNRCSPGREPALKGCKECKDGYYSTTGKLGSCTKNTIQAGCLIYSKTEDACVSCDKNYELVNGKCNPCDINASSLGGTNKCIDLEACQFGTFRSQDRKCTPCQPGTYSNGINLQVCRNCEYGTYQDQYGKETCSPCSIKNNDVNCADCDKITGQCTECVSGYALNEANYCININAQTK